MRSFMTVFFGLAVAALLTAGCGGQQPTAAKPPEQKPAATEQKPAEGPKPELPSTAAVEAATKPVQEAAAAVEIKAQDAAGKLVEMVFKTIYFDFDKYNIKPEFQPAIEQNAALVKAAPGVKLIIEGHCDERGTTEYNLALGEHRAVAVMKAMVAAGAKQAQLQTISYGKEKPVDPGHDEAAWAKNRRGVVRNNAG